MALFHTLGLMFKSKDLRKYLPTSISPQHMRALQFYLGRKLGCAALSLQQSSAVDGSVEVRIGREVVGMVEQVDGQGERSWAITLVVLEEDLIALGLI